MAKAMNVKVGAGLAAIGGILATASVFLYAWNGWLHINASRPEKAFHLVVLCLWIVVPPVWFAIESTYLVDPKHRPEELKKTQELWSRIWVGVSAMLGVVATALKDR